MKLAAFALSFLLMGTALFAEAPDASEPVNNAPPPVAEQPIPNQQPATAGGVSTNTKGAGKRDIARRKHKRKKKHRRHRRHH